MNLHAGNFAIMAKMCLCKLLLDNIVDTRLMITIFELIKYFNACGVNLICFFVAFFLRDNVFKNLSSCTFQVSCCACC